MLETEVKKMSTKEKQNEIIQGIQLVKALYANQVKANKPAAKLWGIISNLQDYFSKGDLDKCEELLETAANL